MGLIVRMIVIMINKNNNEVMIIQIEIIIV